MGCCGTYNNCQNTLVQPRCTDIAVYPILLGDQNGNALVDNNNTALSIGINRVGDKNEYEFNRQIQQITP